MIPVTITAGTTSAVTWPSPPTSTTGTALTASTAICAAVNAIGSNRCENRWPRKIQVANITAQPNVSASPAWISKDAPVSRNNPIAATATAARTRRSGARRVTTISIIGVNTTNSPVMNAEFDVVVRSSPAFWNQ